MTAMENYNYGQQKARAQTLQMIKAKYNKIVMYEQMLTTFVKLCTLQEANKY